MLELSHRERTLRRELSAEETKAIIEKVVQAVYGYATSRD
jgi:hypothetical protein